MPPAPAVLNQQRERPVLLGSSLKASWFASNAPLLSVKNPILQRIAQTELEIFEFISLFPNYSLELLPNCFQ